MQRCRRSMSCQCSKFQQTIGKRHSNAVFLFASLRPAILIESSAHTATRSAGETESQASRTSGKWNRSVRYMKNTTFFASSHTHTPIARSRESRVNCMVSTGDSTHFIGFDRNPSGRVQHTAPETGKEADRSGHMMRTRRLFCFCIWRQIGKLDFSI